MADIYQVDGFGDCAWSVLTAMLAEYRKDAPSLESETKRLGLVVEVYSSEPGCQFQEHYLIAKGDVISSECVDYQEHWVDGYESLEAYNEENDTNFTEDMVNENGDVCIGGFGDDYGVFEDVSEFFAPVCEKDVEDKQPLEEVIKSCEKMNKGSVNAVAQKDFSQDER